MKQGIHPNYVDCTITCAAFFVVMPHKSSLSVIYTPFPYFEHISGLK